MTEWQIKRFWTTATVQPADGGYTITLDARPVRTPARRLLVVPTERMATAIAAEWDAQANKVDPLTMPVTRGANAAIDKVSAMRDEVVEMLLGYGETDLLCYRADAPEGLVLRQNAGWDPILDWAGMTFDAPLVSVAGVMHHPQPAYALANLAAPVRQMDHFALSGFHDLVALSGSLVLALAVTHGRLSAPEAWQLSRIDEHWQIEQWGADDEATATESIKRDAFLAAAAFYQMSLT